mmetsp:Transcript_40032/g.93877  ORF Transcript_40032/g.93877 Transcript_40032/m.93877 type:complete len:178 (-) Transcript_40032:407-940(-)
MSQQFQFSGMAGLESFSGLSTLFGTLSTLFSTLSTFFSTLTLFFSTLTLHFSTLQLSLEVFQRGKSSVGICVTAEGTQLTEHETRSRTDGMTPSTSNPITCLLLLLLAVLSSHQVLSPQSVPKRQIHKPFPHHSPNDLTSHCTNRSTLQFPLLSSKQQRCIGLAKHSLVLRRRAIEA